MILQQVLTDLIDLAEVIAKWNPDFTYYLYL